MNICITQLTYTRVVKIGNPVRLDSTHYELIT